jgi:hypothetical protein
MITDNLPELPDITQQSHNFHSKLSVYTCSIFTKMHSFVIFLLKWVFRIHVFKFWISESIFYCFFFPFQMAMQCMLPSKHAIYFIYIEPSVCWTVCGFLSPLLAYLSKGFFFTSLSWKHCQLVLTSQNEWQPDECYLRTHHYLKIWQL